MTHSDLRGLSVSGASQAALESFEQALSEFQCYIGNPFAAVDRAITAAPDFVMAHCFKAYLNIAATEAAALADARAALAAAKRCKANERERLHIAAIECFVAGEFDRAVGRLDDVLVAYPRDALALQLGHQFDFFRGDARNLRDRVARVMHAWTPADAGYHALLGMLAFGLEECGDYARAEATGREAVSLNMRDGWAWHAVAHVMEMQGRREEGIAWLGGHGQPWAKDSFFAVHNWWHLALYHLDLDQTPRTLEIYDGPVRGGRSKIALEMIDASAMLWRLKLRGVDVGDRWSELAESWAAMVDDGWYAFNDVHAMMAFVGTGRWDLADRQLATMVRSLERDGSNQAMTGEVGLPVSRAIYAFGRGDYGAAVDLLRPIRSIAGRFGGSHAQRDLLDLTLLEAASRGRRFELLQGLAHERDFVRPNDRQAKRYRSAAAEALSRLRSSAAA